MKILLFICLSIIIFSSCAQNSSKEKQTTSDTRNTEAREDSLKMVLALTEQTKITNHVKAIAETKPVATPAGEDAADDPAILD